MPALSEMAMCGGQPMPPLMSMPWLPMPGQTWPAAAAAFLGMWAAMMVPMMLPASLPMLWRYQRAVARTARARLTCLTVLAGAGYFVVWTVLGMPVFALGATLALAEMQLPALARAVPAAAGAVVLVAGALQFTAWKADRLACCRVAAPSRPLPADLGIAWRHGVRLGLQCARCCGNLMVILLAVGVMDLRAMAAVTAGITAERLLPAGAHIARVTGAVAVAAGLLLIARAVGVA